MISSKMAAALNQQIEKELYSSHLYLAMSSWCEAANLPGFAKWLRVQFDEERGHALKLFDYLLDRGAAAAVPAIAAPKAKFGTVQEVFHAVVEHEKSITSSIHKLQAQAVAEGDFATQVELAWFVKEQVEEEKNATLVAAHLDMIGDKSAAILNLDHQAGKRGKAG
jgi:ferritin